MATGSLSVWAGVLLAVRGVCRVQIRRPGKSRRFNSGLRAQGSGLKPRFAQRGIRHARRDSPLPTVTSSLTCWLPLAPGTRSLLFCYGVSLCKTRGSPSAFSHEMDINTATIRLGHALSTPSQSNRSFSRSDCPRLSFILLSRVPLHGSVRYNEGLFRAAGALCLGNDGRCR